MKKLFSLLIFLMFLSTFALGNVSAASAVQSVKAKPIAITNVTIVDVKEGRLQPNMTVVIMDNRIVQVEQSGKANVPKDTLVFNATGKYLIPGLWDMHVHLFHDEEIAFPYLLANGVTGVRDMGATITQINEWKKTLKEGALAPRLVFSGPALDGAETLGDGSLMHLNLKTEAEARAAVKELKQFGVNFLKIYTYLPRSVYYAIADEAEKQRVPFAGHVPFAVSAKEASELGQRSIEHLYGILIASSSRETEIREKYKNNLPYIFSVDLDASLSYDEQKAQELFETFAKNDTHIVPTLVTFHNLLNAIDKSRAQYAPTAVQKMWADYQEMGKESLAIISSKSIINRLYEKYPKLVGDMNKVGVPIMAGTDTLWTEMEPIPNLVFGFSLHDELKLLVEAGLTPLEALQAATITPAQFLGIADSAGSIEAGKWADLVLLDQNPLEDINHTRLISAVVIDGKWLDKQTLQSMVKTYPAPETTISTREK
jgi:imidazolonepropionase-like amidohydrolase